MKMLLLCLILITHGVYANTYIVSNIKLDESVEEILTKKYLNPFILRLDESNYYQLNVSKTDQIIYLDARYGSTSWSTEKECVLSIAIYDVKKILFLEGEPDQFFHLIDIMANNNTGLTKSYGDYSSYQIGEKECFLPTAFNQMLIDRQ